MPQPKMFDAVSKSYATSRPSYPPELFRWLFQLVSETKIAWDVGAGSGQAAVELSKGFGTVIASDVSKKQLATLSPTRNVLRIVCPAESSCIATNSVNLITIAQALHWFNFDQFFSEAKRTLVARGIIAAWSYGNIETSSKEITAIISDYYHNVVGSYWPPERCHVENGYQDIPFPFDRITAPAFAMRQQWTLARLIAYLQSWSATAAFIKSERLDPTARLAKALYAMHSPDDIVLVSWPLTLLVGKKN